MKNSDQFKNLRNYGWTHIQISRSGQSAYFAWVSYGIPTLSNKNPPAAKCSSGKSTHYEVLFLNSTNCNPFTLYLVGLRIKNFAVGGFSFGGFDFVFLIKQKP